MAFCRSCMNPVLNDGMSCDRCWALKHTDGDKCPTCDLPNPGTGYCSDAFHLRSADAAPLGNFHSPQEADSGA